MKLYHDKLQAKIEARALWVTGQREPAKTMFYPDDHEIGLLMFEHNLFYDETVARWRQAVNSLGGL